MTLRILTTVAICCAIGTAQTGARKITQAEALSAAVTRVQPDYPELARQLKIAGSVDIDVTIGENGAVEAVTPVSGNPVLTKPAVEALRKWKFKPFLQGGAPCKAEVVLKIGFTR